MSLVFATLSNSAAKLRSLRVDKLAGTSVSKLEFVTLSCTLLVAHATAGMLVGAGAMTLLIVPVVLHAMFHDSLAMRYGL